MYSPEFGTADVQWAVPVAGDTVLTTLGLGVTVGRTVTLATFCWRVATETISATACFILAWSIFIAGTSGKRSWEK